METVPTFFNLLIEWLSWVLLFFAWAILVKVAMRIFKKKNSTVSFRERKAYYTAMAAGLLLFVLFLLLIVDPFISNLVAGDLLSPENGPLVFWTMGILSFFLFPFLFTGLICRLFTIRTQKER